jgi:LacI family transcriptional regulator
MTKRPRVAILIESSQEYARGLLRGVARYQRDGGPWSIYIQRHCGGDAPAGWLRNWHGDGVLAQITSPAIADMIAKAGVPAVDLSGMVADSAFPFIGVDNQPVAELAYEHLRGLGLRQFAFCGTSKDDDPEADSCRRYFEELVTDAGQTCSVWTNDYRLTWEEQQERLAAWIATLPKPVGIMASNDALGQQILDACSREDLLVPDEVAVIGVGNDPQLCHLSIPSMTSIDVNPSQIGYAAAEMLDRLMRGGVAEKQRTYLGPPRGIAARRSTETLNIDDDVVADALQFIREHATEGILASHVVNRVSKASSTLERRFKKARGRTIKAEIIRVKLNRARLLLTETDYPISTVAERAGFAQLKYFCEVFRKHCGVTATEYRQQFRMAVCSN